MANPENNNITGLKRNNERKDDPMKSMDQSAQNMGRDAGQMAEDLKRNASEMAGQVSDRLKAVGVDTDAMAVAAKDQMTELQKLVEQEVQERPMRTLLIAAGIGLVLGMMTTR